ncbi:MAG: hypothetical protein ACQGVC_01695 [Myxococcota bacterium]
MIVNRVQPQRRVDIPWTCDDLGLPDAPNNPDLSKREYIQSRLDRMPSVPTAIAEKVVSMFPVASGETASFEIEEILWGAESDIEILERHRRELAQVLDEVPLFLRGERFLEALDALWPIANAIDGFLGGGLRDQIEQHVVRNPEDWSVDIFFERIGAYECTSRRFALLIEALAGHRVRPSEPAQREFASVVTGVLGPIGLELRETGARGGYPVYEIVQSRKGHSGRFKNLIFASQGKPDLRFKDALDNNVEVVSREDEVLIFDRSIPATGLRWRDLQDWWADRGGLSDPGIAKETLYRRLLSSLPESSPPQRAFFVGYYSAFGVATPELPALIPEVWLHYDPVTVQQRGRDALLRQRMDFLMLVSSHLRIVLEIDGIQHYADTEGRPDPGRYAETMRSDRDLRLCGYEVYRFGAAELRGAPNPLVASFFRELFVHHGVDVRDSQDD